MTIWHRNFNKIDCFSCVKKQSIVEELTNNLEGSGAAERKTAVAAQQTFAIV